MESRPPASFAQHKQGHTADHHCTRVPTKRALSDMADRMHMLHFQLRSVSPSDGAVQLSEQAGSVWCMSALLIFNRDVLQLADLLQRCLQQITLIKKKQKNIQISVDYLFHYFYLDDAIFSCFYFQTALVVPEVCITTITLKQKKITKCKISIYF